MRQLFVNLLFIVFLLPACAIGQNVELIAADKQKTLRLQTNTIVAAKRVELLKQKMEPAELEFRLDTLGVETYFDKCRQLLEKDQTTLSTADMVVLDYDKAKAYDSLLNKYYKKLAGLLKDDDKKTLVQAQRAWMAFRDSEGKLCGVVGAASGGGTVQQLNDSGVYLHLIITRVVDLFQYYYQIADHL